jgi:alpha-beta hydrolase superfamily lysophospholipase
MSEPTSPIWAPAAVFPSRGLSPAEQAIEPRGWHFVASDGYPLAVFTWPVPHGATQRGCLLVIHGVQSHAGWYHGLGRRLAARGFEAHLPDRRGSGANTRSRGHSPSPRRLLDDLLELNTALRTHEHAQPTLPHAVAGISWGGKLAVCLAARDSDAFQAVALICPGLHPRVGVSTREKWGVALAVLSGRSESRHFPIPLADPRLFTDDPQAQSFIASDPLSLRTGSAALLFASRVIDGWVRRAPERIHIPTLLILAGHDKIVDNDQTRAYYQRLASPTKQLIEYPEGHHTLEFDPDPARYAADLATWLDTFLPANDPNRDGASRT